MKKIVYLLLALALTVSLALPCLAEASYYVHDGPDWLSDGLEEQLAERAKELYGQTSCDYLIVIADDAGEKTGSEYAYDYYYNCPCSADALALYINSETLSVGVFAYGAAAEVYPAEAREALTDRFIEIYNGNDSYVTIFTQYLDAAAEAAAPVTETTETVTETAPVETAPTRPYWYPENVAAFSDFHAQNPPRVVDDADLFTDAQEAEMSAKIEEIIGTYGRDLVVFTDVSSYGLSRNIYAADFYQFNGYGKNADYSGSVLFICMEQGNRGWYTAVRGEAQNTLNYENLNRIDDRLEPQMKAASYFDGVMGYLDDVAETYRTGSAPKPFPTTRLGVSLIVGVIIAFVVVGIMKSKMKTINTAAEARNYLVPGTFDLRVSRDIFLYRTVTRVKREQKSSSGGGGGSFSSSGGGSFSGSGRSF